MDLYSYEIDSLCERRTKERKWRKKATKWIIAIRYGVEHEVYGDVHFFFCYYLLTCALAFEFYTATHLRNVWFLLGIWQYTVYRQLCWINLNENEKNPTLFHRICMQARTSAKRNWSAANLLKNTFSTFAWIIDKSINIRQTYATHTRKLYYRKSHYPIYTRTHSHTPGSVWNGQAKRINVK